MLAEGVCAHTYKEIDKFKVCMLGYVHIWGKYVATGWLCVRGGDCHFKHAPGQGNIVQNTMSDHGTKRNKIRKKKALKALWCVARL